MLAEHEGFLGGLWSILCSIPIDAGRQLFLVREQPNCTSSKATLVCVKLLVARGGGWHVVVVTAEERGEGGAGIGLEQDVKMWEREGNVSVCLSV